MKAELGYGAGLVSLDIPDANVREIIRPWRDGQAPSSETILDKAIIDGADDFQREAAGKRVCVLLADGTRDEPFRTIFERLFRTLRASSSVLFLICTGTHSPDTPQNRRISRELEQVAQQTGITNLRIHAHNCRADRFRYAGKTSRGTEVRVNTLVDDAQMFLVISDVKVHYFAGYSNPIKYFVPGVCAYATTEQNHSLALAERSTYGVHPLHREASRRDNPLAADQLEGMRLIVRDRPVYALTTVGAAGRVCWAGFGPVESTCAEAFEVADRRNTHVVVPAERLIVSPGGLPNDVSLYIAQRALELTTTAACTDGEVLFLAACPDGIGEPQTLDNFYHRLTAPIEEILRSIQERYVLFSHKPYKFAQMIRRLRRLWVHSEMPEDLIRAAHLYPAPDPQKVVNDWITEKPDTQILVIDGANRIALRPAAERQAS